MGEEFVPDSPQACSFALGSQVRTVLFSSDMRRLWVQSHIGKRNAPLMLYKCLAQTWVYHYHTCVVVVHSYLCQAFIKHEWGASNGRGVPFKWVTKPCEYHAVSDMAKPIPSLPQSGQYSWWTLSLKSAFLWGRNLFLATRKLVCPLWGAKPARFCPQAT